MNNFIHTQTGEDDNFIYGNSHEGNVKITDWCIYKKDGKIPEIPEKWKKNIFPKEEYIQRILSSRLLYIQSMEKEKRKPFVERLLQEKYDLYGANYEVYCDN